MRNPLMTTWRAMFGRKPVRIEFTANLTGRFEIELEGRGKQIAQLTVLP